MLIAVISDTHLPRGARRLPDACVERIAAADLLLHAGDFLTLEVLRELEAIGPPVLGVHGNVDSAELRRLLPEERVVEAGAPGSRCCTTPVLAPAAWRACAPVSVDALTWWSSGTHICRCTNRPTTASRSSTRAARRSGAARRDTRWG